MLNRTHYIILVVNSGLRTSQDYRPFSNHEICRHFFFFRVHCNHFYFHSRCMFFCFLMWSQLTKALMDEQYKKTFFFFFFCCKGGIVHKALFGSPPLNVSKRGVPYYLKSWRYICKVDACAWVSPASSKLINIHTFFKPRRARPGANLSQGWFHTRRHELKSIRSMKLQQNTCITLLEIIGWIFSLKCSPE